jgi:hypothetical protein
MLMTQDYVPGACNIGPAEIALRRRAGHAGLATTAVLAAALLRSDLPRPWRLTLAFPAAGAAAGYLQAHHRFCADFGFRGVYNFDRPGHRRQVQVPTEEAHRHDRRRALQIGATSAAIGLGVAAVACFA